MNSQLNSPPLHTLTFKKNTSVRYVRRPSKHKPPRKASPSLPQIDQRLTTPRCAAPQHPDPPSHACPAPPHPTPYRTVPPRLPRNAPHASPLHSPLRSPHRITHRPDLHRFIPPRLAQHRLPRSDALVTPPRSACPAPRRSSRFAPA